MRRIAHGGIGPLRPVLLDSRRAAASARDPWSEEAFILRRIAHGGIGPLRFVVIGNLGRKQFQNTAREPKS